MAGIHDLLIDREINSPSTRPNTNLLRQRKFYKHIGPNHSIKDVPLQNYFFLKFSPCGKYLIGLDDYLTCFYVWEYVKYPTNVIDTEVFADMFKMKAQIPLCHNENEKLSETTCVFSYDGRYMILASQESVAPLNDSRNKELYPDSFVMNTGWVHIKFFVIELETCALKSTVQFEYDMIVIMENCGISMWEDLFAFTSLQNQAIHLIRLNENGILSRLYTIGYNVSRDDDILWSRKDTGIIFTPDCNQSPDNSKFPDILDSTNLEGKRLGALKQKVLSHIYRKILEPHPVLEESNQDDSSQNFMSNLSSFYSVFEYLASSVFWSAHFIDETTLFIQYTTPERIQNKLPDPGYPSILFVLYNYKTSTVLEVFDDHSLELLQFIEDTDSLYTTQHKDRMNLCTFPSCNVYSRINSQNLFRSIYKAKNGGVVQAIRRVASQIPYCTQSMIESPFLDHNVFSYDEKAINNMDRFKSLQQYPVRFRDRETDKVCFSLDVCSELANVQDLSVRYLFHPTDPLVISIVGMDTDMEEYTFHILVDSQNLQPVVEDSTSSEDEVGDLMQL